MKKLVLFILVLCLAACFKESSTVEIDNNYLIVEQPYRAYSPACDNEFNAILNTAALFYGNTFKTFAKVKNKNLEKWIFPNCDQGAEVIIPWNMPLPPDMYIGILV